MGRAVRRGGAPRRGASGRQRPHSRPSGAGRHRGRRRGRSLTCHLPPDAAGGPSQPSEVPWSSPTASTVGATAATTAATTATTAATTATTAATTAATASRPVYALAAGGVAALFLEQAALLVGPLRVSQPFLVIIDPIVSIALSVWLFGERFTANATVLAVAAVAFAVMCAAVVLLTQTAPATMKADLHNGKDDERDG